MTIQHYRAKFKTPDDDHFPGCYWFWQRIPSESEIIRQTQTILKAGFRTAFIQPRISFPREKYLSTEYLSAYAFAAETASRFGLKLGLYDDYNWNSGHAGGRTTENNPAASERHIFWSTKEITSSRECCTISGIRPIEESLGEKFRHWTYVDGKPEWGEWQIVQVIAFQKTDDLSDLSQFVDLTSKAHINKVSIDGCDVLVDIPSAAYSGWNLVIFVSAQCVSSRMINYLDPKAVESFIESGYEPYNAAVGKYFGSTIFCVFVDHPHAGFYTWHEHVGEIGNSLQFHESMEKYFYRQNGYSISMGLLSFFFSRGRLLEKLRTDLFSTYGRFARENFLGKVSAWANDNHLKFAGHELFNFLGTWGFGGGFDSYDLRTDFGADYFGVGSYKDISTVDASNSEPQIAALMGNSISKAHHKYGCMLEQYYWCEKNGLPGLLGNWDLKYEDYRAQAIRHTIFGAKTYICHGFYLTDHLEDVDYELGSPRFDFPPAINYMPWFEYHDHFAQEISKLSSLIFHAKPLNKIGLLYPLRSYWVNGKEGDHVADSKKWSELLMRYGYNFSVVDEDHLSLSHEDVGCIQSGEDAYPILILPGVTTLKSVETYHLLEDFVNHGGTLIISCSVPASFQLGDHSTEKVKGLFENLIKTSPHVHFFSSSQNDSDRLTLVEQIVKEAFPTYPNITFNPNMENVWSWMGEIDQGLMLIFFNDSKMSVNGSAKLTYQASHVEVWDTSTGRISQWPWSVKKDGVLFIELHIEPNEILCLFIRDKEEYEEALEIKKSDFYDFGLEKGSQNHYQFVGNKSGNYTVAYQSDSLRNITLRGGEVVSKVRMDHGERIMLSVQTLPSGILLSNGWSFRTSGLSEEVPIDISEGWEKQGYHDYKGLGLYACDFNMPADFHLYSWLLVFPEIACTAEVLINQQELGILLYHPYEIIVPNSLLSEQNNTILVGVRNTAGNYYYQDNPYGDIAKEPSGLIGAPKMEPILKFEIK